MEHGQLSVKQPGSVLYSGTLIMYNNQDIACVGITEESNDLTIIVNVLSICTRRYRPR